MTAMRWAVVVAGLALGVPLAAQQPEASTLGVQLRGSFPVGDLRTAVGGTARPGVGGSLLVEQDFMDGYRGRLALGTDVWLKGNWMNRPGVEGSVSAVHLGAEAVYMLRTDADPPVLGPYVLAGVAMYIWNVSSTDTATDIKITRQVTHMATSFGFGWRLSGHQDFEIKAVVGKIDPDFNAIALVAGLSFRY